jgi:hypothetical protein
MIRPLERLAGINRASETQWRTSSYAFAGALNATNIEEAFDDIILDLTLKSDKPDLILVGRNIYRLYRAAVRDKITFNLSDTSNGKRMMDLGFTGISHQNIPILYDEDCPVNKAYFINSKYLALHILRHVNMKVKETCLLRGIRMQRVRASCGRDSSACGAHTVRMAY